MQLKALASARDSCSHHCASLLAMAVAAKTKDSSVAVTKHGGGVELLATFLPLKELTDRSARIAQLKLSVFHPWEGKYAYTWSGQEREAAVFKCFLVDLNDPTCYCRAEYKKHGTLRVT